jgi:hypothetical protein
MQESNSHNAQLQREKYDWRQCGDLIHIMHSCKEKNMTGGNAGI